MGNWKGVSYQLSYLRKNKTKRYDTRKAHECNVWREGEGRFRSERGEWSSLQYWRTYWSSQGVRSKWREESFTQPKDQKIKVICLSEMLVKIKAKILSHRLPQVITSSGVLNWGYSKGSKGLESPMKSLYFAKSVDHVRLGTMIQC